jgi:hypothetical protein
MMILTKITKTALWKLFLTVLGLTIVMYFVRGLFMVPFSNFESFENAISKLPMKDRHFTLLVSYGIGMSLSVTTITLLVFVIGRAEDIIFKKFPAFRNSNPFETLAVSFFISIFALVIYYPWQRVENFLTIMTSMLIPGTLWILGHDFKKREL